MVLGRSVKKLDIMNGLSVKRVYCAENEEGMLKIREWSVELGQWDSGTGTGEQDPKRGTGYRIRRPAN